MPDSYNYTDAQIKDRVHSGKDANRAKTIDQWFEAAKAGDQHALQQLQRMGDFDGPGGDGWATPDARNYDRMRLQELGIDTGGYMKKGDGGGFMGSLGDVLKVAAPLAAMAIPGVGMIGAGLIGAGGSALGGALKHEKFDPLKTLEAGVGGAVGNKLLGNGLGSGSSGLFGSSIAGAPNISAMGDATHTPGGVPPIDAGMSASGGGGFLQKAGNLLGGGNGFGMDDVMKIGGTIGAIDSQRSADKQRDQAVQGATQDYNSRAPLRAAGMQQILGLPSLQAPDMSSVFADPGNPYYRPPPPLSARPQTQGYGR